MFLPAAALLVSDVSLIGSCPQGQCRIPAAQISLAAAGECRSAKSTACTTTYASTLQHSGAGHRCRAHSPCFGGSQRLVPVKKQAQSWLWALQSQDGCLMHLLAKQARLATQLPDRHRCYGLPSLQGLLNIGTVALYITTQEQTGEGANGGNTR